eukprot:COSAG01_NODE_6196_length_3799_cov_2.598649_6_plen_185_part_00
MGAFSTSAQLVRAASQPHSAMRGATPSLAAEAAAGTRPVCRTRHPLSTLARRSARTSIYGAHAAHAHTHRPRRVSASVEHTLQLLIVTNRKCRGEGASTVVGLSALHRQWCSTCTASTASPRPSKHLHTHTHTAYVRRACTHSMCDLPATLAPSACSNALRKMSPPKTPQPQFPVHTWWRHIHR